MDRKETLNAALDAVLNDRAETHGDAYETFNKTAFIWSNYLGYCLTAQDVGNMMILLKVIRSKEGEYNPDDYVDIAGYAAIANELTQP